MTSRLDKAFRLGASKRLRLVIWVATIFWLALVGRLFQIQVLQAERYQARAESQNFKQAKQKAGRGTIYDRNGLKLACNISTQSFFAVPDSIKNLGEVASRFGTLFGDNHVSVIKNLRSDRKFVWLERQVELPLAQQVQSWRLKGVYAREEYKRVRPLGELANELIGLTDIDNKGISGLELFYDSLLAGQDGSEMVQKDALGTEYEIRELGWQEAQAGCDLALTLDAKLQWILENRLKQGIAKTKSKSGFGILLDPQTGEI